MAKTINCRQLTPGETYLVRGKAGFCRISRHTTDEERAKANERRTHPVDKNYTTLSLYNAQVLCRDPQNPSLEERYAAESLYRSSSQDYPGNNFTGMNKSKNLPKVGVLDPKPGQPNHYTEIEPSGELAKGLDVTVVMRVFRGQGGNNGVSLDRILVNEPIKYYGGMGEEEIEKSLASYGITFDALPPKNGASAEEEPAAEADEADNPAPAAPPADNAFSAAPAAPTNGAAAATTSTAPPAAPDAPAADNPFGSFASANQTFGPGTRQY